MKVGTLLVTGMALFTVLLASPASAADRSVVSSQAIDEVVVSGSRVEDTQRASVTSVLQKDAVREQAGRMGIEPSRLEAMVSTLSGDQLSQVAQAAANVDEALAGGDSIVIGYTALIIILLVLIIVLVA